MEYSTKINCFKKNATSLLSSEAKNEIAKLSKRKPLEFLSQLIMAWTIIFMAIWISQEAKSVFLSIIMIIVIATRQNVLGLLVHEQTHCTNFKANVGDRFTNFKRPNRMPYWVRPAYFLLVFAILTITQTWGIFLLYWVLPLVTVGHVIVRWGGICEHFYIANAELAEC